MFYKRVYLLLGALALCCGAFGASVGVDDVIRLQRSAVGDDVIMAFVQDSAVAYDLSAEDIQQLDDANVPSTVIVAMLDHGKELRSATGALPVASASPSVAGRPVPSPSAVVYAPPPEQANISLFYETLAPYGTWSQDGGNGWVWEPTDGVRDANWRPYANDGHWVWTDSGWYWESDAPYGWATYHYGRWGYNSRHRWSWAPDNVWGPAWVDWRQSEDHYGWAPLPFGSRFEAGIGFSFGGRNRGFDFHADLDESYYNFVPSGNFLDLHLGLFLEPEHRRRDVYRRTKIVNNTYVYNDNRIINNGVPMAAVQRATNRRIEQVRVVDANIAAGQPIRGERRSANTIEVYRPKLANVAPVEPPAIVARQKAAALRTATAAVKADDRRTATADRQVAEQAARQRIAEQKTLLKEQKTSSAVERKAAAEANKVPKVDASFEKQHANEAAANERKAAAQTSRETKQNAAAEKQSAIKEANAERNSANKEAATEHKAAAETSRETKQNAAAEKQSAIKEANAERNSANKEAAAEHKAAAEASRETKQNAAEDRQSANKASATERSAANKEAAAERSAANREAATEHKAAAETSRETKQNAAEDRQSANKEAAAERKDAAAAEKDSKREERDSAKEEKTHGKK